MSLFKTQLEVLKTLNNIYKNKYTHFSTIQVNVKAITSFSKQSNGTLKIKGRLITSGKYKDNGLGEFNLPAEELKKSMMQWVGTPIYTSHNIYSDILGGKNPSIKEVLGKITSVEWNPEDEGIDFAAEIVDEDASKKISHGLIKSISAGFARSVETEANSQGRLEYFLRNIEPSEASLVFNPRDPKAIFEAI